MSDKAMEILAALDRGELSEAECDSRLAELYDEREEAKKRRKFVTGILWLLLAALLWTADLILILTEK